MTRSFSYDNFIPVSYITAGHNFVKALLVSVQGKGNAYSFHKIIIIVTGGKEMADIGTQTCGVRGLRLYSLPSKV